MKKSLRSLLPAALLAALFLSPAARAAEAELVPVAVFDLDATDPRLKERGSQLAILLTTQLSNIDGVTTVERQELNKLLEEQELGKSSLVDPATAARIGHLTGARVLVTGRIFTIAKETTVAVKVMSTETGRVFGATETFPAEGSPAGAADGLSKKIADILTTRRGDLVAKVATAQDRVAQIKEKAAGRKLPTVSISIPEQHRGPAVADPAAATEISLIFGQAGFTILTPESAESADFRIEGEAFSEAGVRRGNLVACKARVEVKLLSKDGGKVLLADRRTAWAVDTVELNAAKTALQNAGADLAVRIADVLLAKK